MNAKVDAFLSKAKKWQKEMEQMRTILLDCGLTELLKWGKPCYSFRENNIAIIQPFKESCALMFFKGVLLKDPEDILEKPGENSRVARRVAFTNVEEITKIEPTLKAYIKEAIEVEKAGLEVDLEERQEPIPNELLDKFNENPDLKSAFEELTAGRQRGYILYFSDAKQSKTRKGRVEKYIPKILDGKGIHDR
jgi:uncharacterized protein YdeI (YjbR/CyaY-like superfamily)